jgi:hypothetical protein
MVEDSENKVRSVPEPAVGFDPNALRLATYIDRSKAKALGPEQTGILSSAIACHA